MRSAGSTWAGVDTCDFMAIAGSFRSHEVADWFPYDPPEEPMSIVRIDGGLDYRSVMNSVDSLLARSDYEDCKDARDKKAAIELLRLHGSHAWRHTGLGVRLMTAEEEAAKNKEAAEESKRQREAGEKRLAAEREKWEISENARLAEEQKQQEEAARKHLVYMEAREKRQVKIRAALNSTVQKAFEQAMELLGRPGEWDEHVYHTVAYNVAAAMRTKIDETNAS